MASPIGHGLIAVAIALAVQRRQVAPRWWWFLFAVFAANAADLDFIPGIIIGDPNRFHHGASHSIAAVVLFGMICALFGQTTRAFTLRLPTLGMACYASHLILDFLTVDNGAPYGMPLLWPITDTYFQSPWTPLLAVEHGAVGNSLSQSLATLLNQQKGQLLLREFSILPLVLLVYWLRRPSTKMKRPRPQCRRD